MKASAGRSATAALWIGVFAGMAGGVVGRSPTLVVVTPLVAAWVRGERRRRLRMDHSLRLRQGLPMVVDQMIQGLRSGVGLHSVCTDLPSIGPEVDAALRPMTEALAVNRPLVEAVAALNHLERPEQDACRSDELTSLALTLTILAEHGGPAVPALQRLRLSLIGAVHSHARARVQAAQAKASAALLAGAPLSFAGLLALVDRDAAHLYLRESAGTICVTTALLATGIGWRWMTRLVENAVAPALNPGPRSAS